jgi:hypothetical protein
MIPLNPEIVNRTEAFAAQLIRVPPSRFRQLSSRGNREEGSDPLSSAWSALRLASRRSLPDNQINELGREADALDQTDRNSKSRQSNASASRETDVAPSDAVQKVGVWWRDKGDDTAPFIRNAAPEEEELWARAEYISPKGAKRRVVLIGESVARGFMYDSEFNCAIALTELLHSAVGSNEVEVVDLAKSGMDYGELQRLLSESEALCPDAYVVFAGNNWQMSLRPDCEAVIEKLRHRDSWEDAANSKERTDDAVKSVVQQLREISEKLCVPIIFLIPGFNSKDWLSYRGWRDPLLSGLRCKEWRRLRSLNDQAQGHVPRQARIAEAIAALNGGVPIALETMALAANGPEGSALAERLIDEAGEMCTRLPFATPARCSARCRSSLREECERNAIIVVDMARECTVYMRGQLPDSRLFLDFCHLTADGIWLAMACTVKRLFEAWQLPHPSPVITNELVNKVAPRVHSQAHFKAAIVNADRDQPLEIVKYHCLEAIRHSPDMLGLLTLFAESHSRKVPISMCRSSEVLLASAEKFPVFSKLRQSGGIGDKRPNFLLIEAISRAVAEIDGELATQIDNIVRAEHGVSDVETDLLRSDYCDIVAARSDWAWWEHSSFLSTREPDSRFYVICGESCEVKLRLVCRVPHDTIEGEALTVEMNGREVQRVKVTKRWAQYQITIPGDFVIPGINKMTLQWPEPLFGEQGKWDSVVAAYQQVMAEESAPTPSIFYPVYGELLTLCASRAAITPNPMR